MLSIPGQGGQPITVVQVNIRLAAVRACDGPFGVIIARRNGRAGGCAGQKEPCPYNPQVAAPHPRPFCLPSPSLSSVHLFFPHLFFSSSLLLFAFLLSVFSFLFRCFFFASLALQLVCFSSRRRKNPHTSVAVFGIRTEAAVQHGAAQDATLLVSAAPLPLLENLDWTSFLFYTTEDRDSLRIAKKKKKE